MAIFREHDILATLRSYERTEDGWHVLPFA